MCPFNLNKVIEIRGFQFESQPIIVAIPINY